MKAAARISTSTQRSGTAGLQRQELPALDTAFISAVIKRSAPALADTELQVLISFLQETQKEILTPFPDVAKVISPEIEKEIKVLQSLKADQLLASTQQQKTEFANDNAKVMRNLDEWCHYITNKLSSYYTGKNKNNLTTPRGLPFVQAHAAFAEHANSFRVKLAVQEEALRTLPGRQVMTEFQDAKRHYEKENAELKQQVDDSHHQIQAATANITVLSSQLAQATQTIEALKSAQGGQAEKFTVANSQLQTELSSKVTELAQREIELNAVKQQLKDSERQRTKLLGDYEKLNQELTLQQKMTASMERTAVKERANDENLSPTHGAGAAAWGKFITQSQQGNEDAKSTTGSAMSARRSVATVRTTATVMTMRGGALGFAQKASDIGTDYLNTPFAKWNDAQQLHFLSNYIYGPHHMAILNITTVAMGWFKADNLPQQITGRENFVTALNQVSEYLDKTDNQIPEKSLYKDVLVGCQLFWYESIDGKKFLEAMSRLKTKWTTDLQKSPTHAAETDVDKFNKASFKLLEAMESAWSYIDSNNMTKNPRGGFPGMDVIKSSKDEKTKTAEVVSIWQNLPNPAVKNDRTLWSNKVKVLISWMDPNNLNEINPDAVQGVFPPMPAENKAQFKAYQKLKQVITENAALIKQGPAVASAPAMAPGVK